jgi:undecaprenyl-diphosphatase
MPIIHAIVLGLIQGFTEFLPVSSSGHLVLVPYVFGWPEQSLAFDAAIHLATLLAVIVALWPDVVRILKGLPKPTQDPYGKLGWIIALATTPTFLVGFLFKDRIETSFRSVYLVAGSLIVWGVLLYLADRYAKEREKDAAKAGVRRGFLIGCAQVLSLVPGTSRSGVTITAGLWLGLGREAAARFSFLLAIPSIAGAGLFALLDLRSSTGSTDTLAIAVGFLTAFISGLLAIRFLLKILASVSYKWFAVYRIILGVVLMLLAFAKS